MRVENWKMHFNPSIHIFQLLPHTRTFVSVKNKKFPDFHENVFRMSQNIDNSTSLSFNKKKLKSNYNRNFNSWTIVDQEKNSASIRERVRFCEKRILASLSVFHPLRNTGKIRMPGQTRLCALYSDKFFRWGFQSEVSSANRRKLVS